MEKLLAADTYVIETVQEAYLWLWDRTGIYVGTMIFSAAVCEHLAYGRLGWGSFFSLALVGAVATTRYIAQQKSFRLLNAMALSWRMPWLRYFFNVCLTLCVFADVSKPSLGGFLSDLFFALWNYLACICVRDREPKDFFQFRKLAGVGA